MKRVKLDWDKSMKIHTISIEFIKLRHLADKLIRRGRRHQSFVEFKKTEKHALFILQGVKTSLETAKKLHHVKATPVIMERLDECVRVVIKERKEVEDLLRSIKRGA
ncbi:hypothetical protein [Sporosarcina sp. FA9]|uniref:hypothetical protein n=1 Tax=Sporosarcina sp. FA9 TaxID=3413030 RepID=UPI003F65F9FF